jgi:hypothetical protein
MRSWGIVWGELPLYDTPVEDINMKNQNEIKREVYGKPEKDTEKKKIEG